MSSIYEVFTTILFMAAFGYWDKARGSNYYYCGYKISKTIVGLIYAGLVASTVGFYIPISGIEWSIIWLGFFAGTTMGWGSPLGAVLGGHTNPDTKEWWQNNWLKHHPESSLVLRGLMWALCMLPLAWFNLPVFILFLLILPIAMWLSAKATYVNFKDIPVNTWEVTETTRGAMIAFGLVNGLIIIANYFS